MSQGGKTYTSYEIIKCGVCKLYHNYYEGVERGCWK